MKTKEEILKIVSEMCESVNEAHKKLIETNEVVSNAYKELKEYSDELKLTASKEECLSVGGDVEKLISELIPEDVMKLMERIL